MSEVKSRNWLDKLGIAVTSLCALHCIFLPVLLPVLPLLGLSFLADHAVDHVVLILTFAIGSIALFSGFHKYHRKLYPFYSLAIGVMIYASRDFLGEAAEPYVLTIGSALIVLAHVMNMRLCKSCKSC